MDRQYIERRLDYSELEERRDSVLAWLGERDEVLGVVERCRELIKAEGSKLKQIDARIGKARRELKSGKVLEARQQELPIEVEIILPGTLADAAGNAVDDPRDPPQPRAAKKRARKPRK